VRYFAKEILVAAVVASMVIVPASAANSAPSNSGAKASSTSNPAGKANSKASPKALGLIVESSGATLDSSEAAIGTTVFAGDALETQAGGLMRVRVGSSQLYLLAASAATLVQPDATPQAHVLRGSVGFSTLASNQFELETPVGVIRSEAAAYGQVRVVGPEEIVVTSLHGNLTIELDGDVHMIENGKSYDVTIEPDGQATSDNAQVTPVKRHRRIKLAAIIVVGTEAVVGYYLWRWETESCHNFSN
jgi:hypothetical protein